MLYRYTRPDWAKPFFFLYKSGRPVFSFGNDIGVDLFKGK